MAQQSGVSQQAWKGIFHIGAVFEVPRNSGQKLLFEVVGTYDAHPDSVDQAQVVLVRLVSTGTYGLFSERDIDWLELSTLPPRYIDSTDFLRAPDRSSFGDTLQHGRDIRETGAVFDYHGPAGDPRNGTWETFYVYSFVGGVEGCSEKRKSEVVIARGYDRGVVAEFGAADLVRISILPQPSRFIQHPDDHCTVIPVLDIWNDGTGS